MNLSASDIVIVTLTFTVTVTVTVSLGQFRNQLPLCRRTQLHFHLETILKPIHVSIVNDAIGPSALYFQISYKHRTCE